MSLDTKKPHEWRPSGDIHTLRARAKILAKIREFFNERDVLEVETPSLSQSTVTDIHLHTFQTEFVGPGYANGQKLYLMTSPEFHMKRLLAAGSESIFQISRVYRNEECGRHHNPEFSMLEWYRVDFDHHDLMDEMDDLLQQILVTQPAERRTYPEVFKEHVGCCPLESEAEQLRQVAINHGFDHVATPDTDRDTLLQLLFSMLVEPQIGKDKPIFVYDFPASQAALAKVNAKDPRVADRFEVYFKGIELANGFHELEDAQEQRQRFEQDNASRQDMGLATQPIDEHLLSALEHGLPQCAGVALGIDRLVMLALGKRHIEEVLAFALPRA